MESGSTTDLLQVFPRERERRVPLATQAVIYQAGVT